MFEYEMLENKNVSEMQKNRDLKYEVENWRRLTQHGKEREDLYKLSAIPESQIEFEQEICVIQKKNKYL